MQQKAKTLAQGYLSQALALLPKVGIDDRPGDGGAAPGKLTRSELVDVHLALAKAQEYLGQKAAAKAIVAKLPALILVGGKPDPFALDSVLDFLRDFGYATEAIALHRKYNPEGYGMDRLVKRVPDRDKPQVLRDALAKAPKIAALSDRAWQYHDLSEAALLTGFAGERDAARAALVALTPQLLADPEANVNGLVALCSLHHKQVEVPELPAVERALRSQEKNAPGYVAMGLLYLRRDTDAAPLLTQLTADSSPSDFPDRLPEILSHEAYLALLKRCKKAELARRGALNPLIKVGNDDDLRPKLLALAESLAPDDVTVHDWYRLQESYPTSPTATLAQARIRARLKKELPEQEKYWKSRPATGEMLSSRQAEWGQIAEAAALAEPALVAKFLVRITEPRRRLTTLAALAHLEARQSVANGSRR